MPLAVLHSLDEWLERFERPVRTVLTIGNFDGVHLGHRKILATVVQRARATNYLATAITFSPHPLAVLRPESAPPLLETLEQRLRHFDALGLDAALVLHFDHGLASLSPENFVRRILCDTLRANCVLVGENFRFGHKQAGDVAMLRELGGSLGFEVECIPRVNCRGTVVSSTAVRQAVVAGDVGRAVRLLGRPFALAGEIRTGTGTGHRILFPTLNLSTSQEVLPAHGVYATETVVEGRSYRSATNVGVRPTFDGTHLTIESHLFDFSRRVTNGPLEVRFWHRLRAERKFSGPDALREQIQRDIVRARSFFARLDGARRIVSRQS
ncbi:MAG TPA: bifunctional riboflavin kinase/FAD synthetase [Candidatus Acidoferrales bacterium]|nr:bifunctional riboflavin kinase/FAD synthetase [Candidatus Acidoferrales bacterium]